MSKFWTYKISQKLVRARGGARGSLGSTLWQKLVYWITYRRLCDLWASWWWVCRQDSARPLDILMILCLLEHHFSNGIPNREVGTERHAPEDDSKVGRRSAQVTIRLRWKSVLLPKKFLVPFPWILCEISIGLFRLFQACRRSLRHRVKRIWKW